MREIRFRAWDKRMKEWDYLNLEDVFDWEFHQTLFYCDADTLGQYTGLKDKNGIEIYEGDILATRNRYGEVDMKGQVSWDEKDARFLMAYPLNSFEVIGNIWEQSYLLDTKTEK